MALETVVFLKDPFSYGGLGCKDLYSTTTGDSSDHHGYHTSTYSGHVLNTVVARDGYDNDGYSWAAEQSHHHILNHNNNNSSSPEQLSNDDQAAVWGGIAAAAAEGGGGGGRRKRRRLKSLKNKEEMENQRMTHIAVERNRRKQMNEYLAVLRSLMPPSYAQRGDQASIVGGAINFVKELEHLVQLLEARLQANQPQSKENNGVHSRDLFSNFFTFPQYSTSATRRINSGATAADMMISEEKQSNVADIEVAMVESHANIKVLSAKRPKQLLRMVTGLQSMCLTILHLNITTVDHMVLYSFSVKVEDECQLTTVNEIATAVHDMVGVIHEEAISS